MSEQLARKLFDRGQLPQAKVLLEPFHREGRLSNDGILMYGICCFRLHEIRPALDIMHDLLRRDPTNAYAHYYAGLCEERLGNPAAATTAYRQALASKPDFAEAAEKVAASATAATQAPSGVAAPTVAQSAGAVGGPAGEARRGYLRGQVRHLQGRGGTRYRQTLSFRLVDRDGSIVEVTMTGTGQVGSINEGDWVEVRDRRKKGLVQADEVRNLTTGAQVRFKGEGCVFRTAKWFVIILFLAGAGTLAYAILSSR